MRDRQIIFMSMDKFLSLNSTIVEPSTMLYNSNIIENAVIFIDEFDATKETVLKNIIQNGLRDRLDYIELFNAVYAVLHTHSFPAILTTPSKKRQEGQYKNQSLQGILNKTMKIADDIHKSFALQYSHKIERIEDDNKNNFLFQDHQYHTILNGNKSYITSNVNLDERINIIKFSDVCPEIKEDNIQTMLGQLRGFISYFLNAVYFLAINYMQLKAERRNINEDEFTLEEAIRTILSEFKLTNIYISYLTSQILVSSYRYLGDIQSVDFDLSFYEKGFRYYAFEDDYTHDMHSEIMMCSFQVTPEKLLLRFCEKAQVLGISATATIPSAIGNYDIEYLKEKLQNKYISITAEEKERLRIAFENSAKGYDEICIHTKLISADNYSVSAWEAVTDDAELAQHLFDYIEQACSEDDNNYNKERYLRIAITFKSFICQTDIQSFLCVLTKHPRKNDRILDLDKLLYIFKIIVNIYKSPFDVDKNVVQLDGEEYDLKKDKIITRLGKGERLFVISVYQTIGAGQNLQYPIPTDLKNQLVKINDYQSSGYKDFDAIYLDKPTNLLTPLSDNLAEEDFVKYLFYLEMLQEGAEISVKDATSLIKKAFRCFGTKSKNNEFSKNINDCRSVISLSTRVIIQAIGRLCRTNSKSKNIYIFADSRIADRIDFSVCEGRTFNREFTELIQVLSTVAKERNEYKSNVYENEAQLKSIRVTNYINNTLGKDWNDNKIISWKQLREMVLMHPTISQNQFDDKGIAYNFYVEMPNKDNHIYYIQKNDFKDVWVFFSPHSGAHEVSAETSKLSVLMQIDFLKDYFENQGWATSFIPDNFIMSPPLFNNIYRGVLGEVVGKILFHHLAGIELHDIENNDLYEKFDYVVPNASVFVDFKIGMKTVVEIPKKKLIRLLRRQKNVSVNV